MSASHPDKKKRLHSLLAVSLVLILTAGGLLFTFYSSYTPLRTLFTLRMSNSVSSVAWSPDGQEFAAVTVGQNIGTGNAMVILWRTRDAQELLAYTFPSPPEDSSQLAWAPDGKSFALGWSDGSIEIWEAKAGNDSSSWSQNVSFHIDGRSGNRGTYITGLAWSATSKHLLVSYSDGLLFAWDVQNRHMLPPILAPQVAGEKSSILALSPHGTQAIISSQHLGSDVPIYAIWDVATGKEMPVERGTGSSAWTSDENTVAMLTVGEQVMIWHWDRQSTSWTFVRAITVATPLIGANKLAWSADGKRLATVDFANVIRLWNAENGSLIGPQFPLFEQPISRNDEYYYTDTEIIAMAWSPNGKYLLSGDGAQQVILREVL